jgi:predicted CoA-substrate-specific enzyme activase
MKTLGICFGATMLQAVILEAKNVQSVVRIPHEGNPKKIFLDFLASLNLSEIDKIAVTGRNFRKNVCLSSISEPVAIEQAIKAQYPDGNFPDFIISAGGETQLAYKISKQGNILSVHSGNKCASGTGEFFLQQIGRMNLPLDEAIKLAGTGTPHKIAGRCSVFCKSDCTHALNKGEPKQNVIAGLCHMMVDRMVELFKDRKPHQITFIGGGSLNPTLVNILSSRIAKVDVPKLSGAFEAYGAALWAVEHDSLPVPKKLINDTSFSFGFHEPLCKALPLVTFKENQHTTITPGATYILGLDVGSTTTKAVLMHKDTHQIAASVYGRTNGNPIAASKYCYAEIRKQIGTNDINIVALGVTGSGRQIAALHALSNFVINEIIAHATAAAYFDPEVDTIFEIGGQDAKYTYLTGGVPSDYAMNEACSAGTGSFLEESAKESLNVKTEDIGDLALQGTKPPNFTDQCAAFISSDIKRASQEGISKNDILAGLVYSICLNYTNRVKESRPMGKKIFMQGGVCYNKAVPVAMASLIQTPIVVPPNPGLMGAFGVALEIKKQLDIGLMASNKVDLDELITRDAKTIGTFICSGGKEKCDRKCEIAKIDIKGEIHPFGGACDRYYNLRLKNTVEPATFDYVAIRQDLLFNKYVSRHPDLQSHPGLDPGSRIDSRLRGNDKERGNDGEIGKTIGIINSFLTHSLAPLYTNFFSALGFNIVFPDQIDPDGIARIESAFCLPAEISHGAFLNLINKHPDYIFLPHIMEIPVPNVKNYSKACVFVQGEAYYLKTTFRQEIEQSNTQLVCPVLNMRQGYEQVQNTFITMAKDLGITKKLAKKAFAQAIKKQQQFEEELLDYGKKALTHLDEHPETFGIVLLGRPYNAFTDDANMGIPHKVASRGVMIIPFDMLPIADQSIDKKIYWAMGQKIMKTAKLIKQRDNLFGFFITNFSCGPDSFILNFFRNHMGMKPSLTLELDQHTADAGIDTRIEAALTIMKSYRNILGSPTESFDPNYQPAQIIYSKNPTIISSSGVKYSLQDPQVEMVFPSMGRLTAEGLALIFKSFGINSRSLSIPDKDILLEGKKNTLCKECLPYILTTGSFMSYLKTKADPNKIILLFLVTSEGPCRLGQYCKSLQQLIIKNKISNVAVFTLTDENCYAGLGVKLLLRSWQGMVVLDVLNDIKSMLNVTAQNKHAAMQEFENIWQEELIPFLKKESSRSLTKMLTKVNYRLQRIPLKQDPKTVPVISLIGEIFVRQEEFSRQNIVSYLEERGFMVKVAPISEYICYINYLGNNNISDKKLSFSERARFKITSPIQTWWEKRIKSVLAKSGLYKFEMVGVDKTVACAEHLIDKKLMGEGILTVGLGLREILHDSCGVISIGPFGCMPTRFAESILRKEMNVIGKQRLAGWEQKALAFKAIDTFPYLSIETDGNPFPQMIEANLEAFILQAKRVWDILGRDISP